jgi:beta-propeller repeat-containing protein
MKTAISVVVFLVLVLGGNLGAQPGSSTGPSLVKAALFKLPIYFIENRGVYPDEVAYHVQGADRTLFFTKDGITFRLDGKDRGWVVKLEFVGASPDVKPEGQDRQQAVFSSFKGPAKDWKTGLKTYARVVYENLWPGIDLVYRGTVNQLKYDFVVKPGADPEAIRLRVLGASDVLVTKSGGLRIRTPAGDILDDAPVACQEASGGYAPVEAAFVPSPGPNSSHCIRFRVGEYDRTRTLILDPAFLVYCGFIGGIEADEAAAIAVDSAGNVYVAGNTKSTEATFPVRVGPDLTYNTGPVSMDGFVAKVAASGTALIYCGYLGGDHWDECNAIAVDSAGCAYVTGLTDSSQATFPVLTGPDLTYNGGCDAFVAKVNASGNALEYCGYIGGSDTDHGMGIAVDAAGNAVVAGHTCSTEASFPVLVGPDLTHNSGPVAAPTDGFVARVAASGKTLVFCGYVGGDQQDEAVAVAVDAQNRVVIAGWTESTETTFPVKTGPDLTYNGRGDAFVARVAASGASLDYCGYIGGDKGDRKGFGIAVDSSGRALVTGQTSSPETSFPVKVGPDLTYNGGGDAFVARVAASGASLDYCGYIGGSGRDHGAGIAVDGAGCAVVVGCTESEETSFPVKEGPDLTHNGGPAMDRKDAFVARVAYTGASLVHCGYVGGSMSETATGVAVDRSGNVYVAGYTGSDQTTFPVLKGPGLTFGGNISDAFVAKVAQVLLGWSGNARPGGRVDFGLAASEDAGLAYQVGSSLATGPIMIDTRPLGLSADDLLFLSLSGLVPGVFAGYAGTIGVNGRAGAAVHIPDVPALVGFRIHTAFVTLDGAAPSGIRSISNTVSFLVGA